MKRTSFILATIVATMLASGCAEDKGRRAATVNDKGVMVLDCSQVTDTADIALGELAGDYELIRFERGEQSMFQFQWAFFSGHYVCIKQGQGPLKLFDNEGHFIHDVGAVGHGPGEYVGVYDVAIDETRSRICVAPFVGNEVLIYDLEGRFRESIPLRDRVNKPRVQVEPDGTISLVHLCFSDFGSEDKQFTTASLKPGEVRYGHQKELTTNVRNKEGQTVGFNNEIFAYGNTQPFAFQITSADTLYHYDSQAGTATPYFTRKQTGEADNGFALYNELPHHVLTGLGDKLILTEKKSGRATYARFSNDYLGGIGMYPMTQDGYVWKEWAPEELRDELKEALGKGGMSAKDEKRLRELVNSLKDDDNDILFRARLKK